MAVFVSRNESSDRLLGLARLTAARQEQVRAGLLEDGVASYKPVPEAVRVGADN